MSYHKLLAVFLLLAAFYMIVHTVDTRRKKRKRLREWEERQRQKGEEGEMDTALFLNKVRGIKRLLHHVYIPKAGGSGTTEIDLLMIHEKGIIVIENKNYSGFLYGREEETYWTQMLKGGEYRRFYNPVMQNQGHIRHLKHFLGDLVPEETPYISVITFNDQGRLKRIRVDKKTAVVASARQVKRRLGKRLKRLPRALSRSRIEELERCLLEEAGNTKRARKNHIKQVRSLYGR